MLYLLHGPDTYRSRAKLRSILERFSAKPDHAPRLFSIDAEDFDVERMKELIASRSLFGDALVVVARQLLEDPARAETVFGLLPALAESPNLFFFAEGELERQCVDRVKAYARETQEFRPLSAPALRRWVADRARVARTAVSRRDIDTLIQEHGADLFALEQALAVASESEGDVRFVRAANTDDVFAACDAIFEGPGRRAWVALEDFFYRGGSAEELFWKLVWQAKNIVLVKRLSVAGRNAASESELHPFVAKKSLRFGAKFEYAALSGWWEELIGSLHDSRLAGNDMRAVVERAAFRLHRAKASLP